MLALGSHTERRLPGYDHLRARCAPPILPTSPVAQTAGRQQVRHLTLSMRASSCFAAAMEEPGSATGCPMSVSQRKWGFHQRSEFSDRR